MVKQLYQRQNDKRIVLCHFNPTFDGRALLDEMENDNRNYNSPVFIETWEYLGLSPDNQVLQSSRFPAEHIDRKRLLTRTIPYAIVWAPRVGDANWFERLDEENYRGVKILLHSKDTSELGGNFAYKVECPLINGNGVKSSSLEQLAGLVCSVMHL